MANMVIKESYGIDKNILIANDSYLVTLPAQVTNTGLTADSENKKILKAGTPLSGDITKRGVAFKKATTTTGTEGKADTSNATAILLHDVDVTDGANNATIVLAGCVDTLKLDAETKALLDTATKAALSRIIFVEGSSI